MVVLVGRLFLCLRELCHLFHKEVPQFLQAWLESFVKDCEDVRVKYMRGITCAQNKCVVSGRDRKVTRYGMCMVIVVNIVSV